LTLIPVLGWYSAKAKAIALLIWELGPMQNTKQILVSSDITVFMDIHSKGKPKTELVKK